MNRASKIGHALAMIIQCLIITALGSMVLLQILNIRELTLTQVCTAMGGSVLCEMRMGRQKKTYRIRNGRSDKSA